MVRCADKQEDIKYFEKIDIPDVIADVQTMIQQILESSRLH